MGMSYQGLATIAAPFDGRYNSRARLYLTKAMELAPDAAGLPPRTVRLSVGLRRLLADRVTAGAALSC